jgi:hypothetical protein
MGAAEELKAMATRQELELIEPSALKASELVTDARRSLATCRAIAASDPKSTLWGTQIHVRQKAESIHNPEMVPALDGGVAC